MNITIASIALLTSLTNVTSLPQAENQVVPSKMNTFSKDEIVKILEKNQQENQKLDGLIAKVSRLTFDSLETNMRSLAFTSAPKNSATLLRTKRKVNADE
jgi:hypothetical protein